MAHYAKVVDGKVETVIVADEQYVSNLKAESGVEWIQTSYNTYGNVHYGADGKPDDQLPFRGNYAQIGFVWDEKEQVFHPPRPFLLWILNKKTWLWEPPIPRPDLDGFWKWSDKEAKWVQFDPKAEQET